MKLPELPPLPRPDIGKEDWPYPSEDYFTADQMRAYAQEAARQEREAIAADWEREHGFDKYGVAEEIRSRSTSPSTPENTHV